MKKNLMVGAAAACILTACGERAEKWDARVDRNARSLGLVGSVVVLDEPLNRALILSSPSRHSMSQRAFKVGKNVAAIAASADKDTLFVLSKGVQPRRDPGDEFPSVTVIDGGPEPSLKRRFEFSDPMQELAVDPEEQWLVAFKGDSTVTNPNEFVLFPLEGEGGDNHSITIRSFGGVPQEALFTQELVVPRGAERRFLIVRTERDIALIDLADLERDEVTVQTPLTNEGSQATPAEVVFDAGRASSAEQAGRFARIGVRLQGQSDVMLLELGEPASGSDKDFGVHFNIVNVGGVPSSVEFVETDFGLRLAALVPSLKQAKLIDPETTIVESVEFPKPYSRLTRVSQDAEGGELALLYDPASPGIAFWALGRASARLSKSVEQNEIDLSVAAIHDVPGENFGHLKILEGAGAERFFVLDLQQRQSFPMLTRVPGFTLSVAPDGQRAWAFHQARSEFASISLSDLHPTSLSVSLPVSAVYDIERADGTRAALCLHGTDGANKPGNVGVTLLDAEEPDSADTRYFGAITLGGL